MNEATRAFARAASRGGPLFKVFHAYRCAKDDKGRNSGSYDFAFAAPGALKWLDSDDNRAQATLYSDWTGPIPDALQAPDGEWFTVHETKASDTLGAGLRLTVYRMPDAPPIRAPAP